MLILAALGLVGCRSTKASTGFPIASYGALMPDRFVETECSLELAGSKYKAEVKLTRSGNELQIDLVYNDTVIESERYLSTEDQFAVIDAGGERYEPPIPLIKYPMHVGDDWEWNGKVRFGPTPDAGSAKVKTSSEDMTIEGGTVHNVVHIEVSRSIDSGLPGSVSTRKLEFWIAPKLGVVKRSFGTESMRYPLEP